MGSDQLEHLQGDYIPTMPCIWDCTSQILLQTSTTNELLPPL